jgi:hypothetical protein
MKEKITSILVVIILLTAITAANAENLSDNWINIRSTQEQSGPLSHLFDKQTIPLLIESFNVSSRISDILKVRDGKGRTTNYIDSTIPRPGIPKEQVDPGSGGVTVFKAIPEYQKGWTQLENREIIISNTSLQSGVYNAWISEDDAIIENTNGKIAAVWFPKKAWYIATGASVTGNPNFGIKECLQSELEKVAVNEANIETGTLSAFNGPDSAVIIGKDGSLIAVLIGSDDNCDLYIPTKAEVTGTLIQSQKEAVLPNGGKAVFPEVSLKPGTYKAVNSLDCAFIFDDKNEVIAILSKDNDTLKLHVACTVEVKESPLDSPLRPGTYKAFNGSDYAIIFDADGNPVDVNLKTTDINPSIGAWYGTTNQGIPVSFQVSGDGSNVEFFRVEIPMSTGNITTCLSLIGIKENKFTFKFPGDEAYISCEFVSNTKATGNLEGEIRFLGKKEPISGSWEANYYAVNPEVGPLIFLGYEAKDDKYPTSGDSDGNIEEGESIILKIKIRNAGKDAFIVKADLSSDDDNIKEIKQYSSVCHIPRIEAGKEEIIEFLFNISKPAKTHNVLFLLKLTAGNGEMPWITSFEIPILRTQVLPCLKGDVNDDGNIKSNDATLILRIAAGLLEPNDYQKCAADVNSDGKIRSNDAIIVLRKAAGLEAPVKDLIADRRINISLSEAHGLKGETISVPITVDNIDILSSGDISFSYDSKVLRAIDVLSSDGLLMANNINQPGLIRISFAGVERLNNGKIAEIKFEVLTDDISPLTFKLAELYGTDAVPLNSRVINKQFRSWAVAPEHSELLQNYPNPFNPETWIPYQLHEANEVVIRIHNITGGLVRELRLGYKPAGQYTTQDRSAYWDGRNEAGERVSSGVYFYNIQTGKYSSTMKMIVTK